MDRTAGVVQIVYGIDNKIISLCLSQESAGSACSEIKDLLLYHIVKLIVSVVSLGNQTAFIERSCSILNSRIVGWFVTENSGLRIPTHRRTLLPVVFNCAQHLPQRIKIFCLIFLVCFPPNVRHIAEPPTSGNLRGKEIMLLTENDPAGAIQMFNRHRAQHA